jgi:PAS domain S-box-containing protein
MTIRLKIFLGFLVVFLIFGGAFYYIVSSLRTLPSETENLENIVDSLTNFISISGLVTESKTLRSDIGRLTATYLLSPQSSIENAYQSTLSSLVQVLDIANDKIAETDSPERTLFTALGSNNNELVSIEQSIFTEAKSGNLSDARSRYLNANYSALSDNYFEAIRKYSKYQIDTGNDIFSDVISSFDAVSRENREILRINQIFIVIVVVAGVLVFLFAGLFSYSVSRPIMLLTKTAERISKGDTLARAPIISNDETGMLAASFNRMAGSMVSANKKVKQALHLSQHNENLLAASVTALEQARAELLDQVLETKKFSQAVESATDGVVIVKINGDIMYVNPAWEKLTGYSASEVIGKKPRVLSSSKTNEKVYGRMWDTLSAGKPFVTDEILDVRKNGEEYQVQLAIFPILEGGKTQFYVLVEQDITDRKEIDRAKTEFVSLASHQLRTPLSTTNWYTELLLERGTGNLNEKQRKYLEEIYKSNKNMIDLVSTLLNVSRIELGTLKVDLGEVSPAALMENVIAAEKVSLDRADIKLVSEIEDDVPKIKSDEKLLRMVFQNLVSNAIKYTPNGGRVTVILRKGEDGGIEVQVADTGMGIPEKDQGRIFTKMFRADNVREKKVEGTGLGLYIVKSVIEYFGGKIWFKSAEDKGSTFYVTLPPRPEVKEVGQKKSPI